jgi:hypothetical protein
MPKKWVDFAEWGVILQQRKKSGPHDPTSGNPYPAYATRFDGVNRYRLITHFFMQKNNWTTLLCKVIIQALCMLVKFRSNLKWAKYMTRIRDVFSF